MLNYYKSIILLKINFKERLLIKKYFVFNYLTGDYRSSIKLLRGPIVRIPIYLYN